MRRATWLLAFAACAPAAAADRAPATGRRVSVLGASGDEAAEVSFWFALARVSRRICGTGARRSLIGQAPPGTV